MNQAEYDPHDLDEVGFWANEPMHTIQQCPGVYVVHGGKEGAQNDFHHGRRAIYSYFRGMPSLREAGHDPIMLTPEAARAYLAGAEVEGMEGARRRVWIRKNRERHY